MDEWKAWRESLTELAKGNGPGPKTAYFAIKYRCAVNWRADAPPPDGGSNPPWEPSSWLTQEQIAELEREDNAIH